MIFALSSFLFLFSCVIFYNLLRLFFSFLYVYVNFDRHHKKQVIEVKNNEQTVQNDLPEILYLSTSPFRWIFADFAFICIELKKQDDESYTGEFKKTPLLTLNFRLFKNENNCWEINCWYENEKDVFFLNNKTTSSSPSPIGDYEGRIIVGNFETKTRIGLGMKLFFIYTLLFLYNYLVIPLIGDPIQGIL